MGKLVTLERPGENDSRISYNDSFGFSSKDGVAPIDSSVELTPSSGLPQIDPQLLNTMGTNNLK